MQSIRTTPQQPPVTILKPLCGEDPDLTANLSSFFGLDYGGYQIVFGAVDPDDVALSAAREVSAAYPDQCTVQISGGDAEALNGKIANIANMLPAADHEILVLSDSDMRVGRDYLKSVARGLAMPEVGLVTFAYRAARPNSLPAVFEALGICTDFMPSVMLARCTWGMRFAFGSTIVISRETLDAIGGPPPMLNELADDYLLGSQTAAYGKRVVLADIVLETVLGSESWNSMWSRRLRWCRTMRALQPAAYAGTCVTHGLPAAVALLVVTHGDAMGWGLLAATLVVRGALATWVARACLGDKLLPRALILVPVADMLSFVLWAVSFFGSTIKWRGKKMRVTSGGRLQRL